MSPPFSVLVENYRWDRHSQSDEYRLIEEFLPSGSEKFPALDELLNLDGVLPFDWTRSDAVSGTAYAMKADGTVFRYAFRTMPRAELFHEFIRREVARRGGATVASGTEFQVHLHNPPAIRAPGTPKRIPLITWNDCWWKWDDGVLLWSEDPATFDLSARDLQRHIRVADRKDWYLYVEPQAVPERLRDQHFQRYADLLYVRMQKTDFEPDVSHAVRKAFGENAITLLKSALTEVDSIVATQKRPRVASREPFRAEIVINIKSRSQLAGVISQVRSHRALPPPVADGVAVLQLNAAIPKDFLPTLNALVDYADLPDSMVAVALKQVIGQRVVRGSGALLIKDDQSILTAEVDTPGGQLTTTGLAAVLGGSVREDGCVVLPLALPFFGPALPVQTLGLRPADNRLIARLAVDRSDPGSVPEHSRPPASGLASPACLVIEGDLTPALSEEKRAGLRVFMDAAVRAYQGWCVGRKPEALRRFLYGSAQPDLPVTSMFDTLKADGDNRIQLRLATAKAGTSIRADVLIGRDLYGWLMARRLLSAQTLHKSSWFHRPR